VNTYKKALFNAVSAMVDGLVGVLFIIEFDVDRQKGPDNEIEYANFAAIMSKRMRSDLQRLFDLSKKATAPEAGEK
jgi:hypothetical protein